MTDLNVICLVSNVKDGGRVQMDYRYLQAATLPDHLSTVQLHLRTAAFAIMANPIGDDQADITAEELQHLRNELNHNR